MQRCAAALKLRRKGLTYGQISIQITFDEVRIGLSQPLYPVRLRDVCCEVASGDYPKLLQIICQNWHDEVEMGRRVKQFVSRDIEDAVEEVNGEEI